MGARRRSRVEDGPRSRRRDGRSRPVPVGASPFDELRALAGNETIARLLRDDPVVVSEDAAAEREADAAERAGRPPAERIGRAPGGRGGARLDGHVRRRMEQRTGADLSQVRVHTGREAGQLVNALGAEAMTRGGDVFFAPGRFSPGSTSGERLLAHELTHATRHDPGAVHLKRVKKHLDFVRMKRKDTKIARMLTAKALGAVGAKSLAARVDPEDAYGHWWVEVGHLSGDRSKWVPTKSYGWWPAHTVNIAQTLKIETVAGQLNQGQPNDHHHGDRAEVEFHPVLDVDDTESYDTVRTRVEDQIDTFATGFRGSWNWRLAWGKNCHTFQDRMKKQLHLHHQKAKQWLQDPAADATMQATEDAAARQAFLDPWRPLRDRAGYICVDVDNTRADPMPTEDEMAALSDADKQAIIDFIGCTRGELRDWASWHYMRVGYNLFDNCRDAPGA